MILNQVLEVQMLNTEANQALILTSVSDPTERSKCLNHLRVLEVMTQLQFPRERGYCIRVKLPSVYTNDGRGNWYVSVNDHQIMYGLERQAEDQWEGRQRIWKCVQTRAEAEAEVDLLRQSGVPPGCIWIE